MNQLHNIREAVDAVLRIMAEHEYAADTIKSHQGILNSLMKYLAKNHYLMNESVGLAYIKERTGIEMEGLWGRGNQKINTILKPIQNLLYYLDEGDLTYFMRSKIKPFVCPPSFEYEYQLFQKEYRERHYADATIVCNNNIVNKLLTFLYDKGVGSSARITASHLTDFLAGFVECKPKYISTVLYVMKNYLSFLEDMGVVKTDLSALLPHVRILRNAFIPHAWKTDDVKKLLASIDRSAAKGKRDFAILLLAARLGLRVGDIRNLRLSNLNWNRKIIALSMQKTGQPLELPILDDIGWAIIDYLKNGRPQTKCDRLFVRHRAPYDAFGENDSFYNELHRYMQSAGITPPSGVHCGLHSLRSTLARNMLEAKAPLPVISETLGHSNVNTTSIYLKIELDGLRKCALDPEEVFQS